MSMESLIVQACDFKQPKGGYKDRQDFLVALLKVLLKLDDKPYDKLCDKDERIGDWLTKATTSFNNRKEVADFPDVNDDEDEEVEDEDEDEEEDDEEGEADEEAEDDTDVDEDVPDSKAPPADDDEGDGDEDEEAAAAEEAEAEAANEAEEAAIEAKKSRSKKVHHPLTDEKPKVAKVAKAAPKKLPPAPKIDKIKLSEEVSKHFSQVKGKIDTTRYDNMTGEKDRYGVIDGSKTHDAVMMYEKGATSKEIENKLGGRYYNILHTLEQRGHRVEKLPGESPKSLTAMINLRSRKNDLHICTRYPCGMMTDPLVPSGVLSFPDCPVNMQKATYLIPQGCICPPTSEKTCENPTCPRQNHQSATISISTK